MTSERRLYAAVVVAGLLGAALVAVATGIPAGDAGVLIAISFGVALGCWLLSVVIVTPISERWMTRRAGVRFRASVIALTPALSLSVGAWIAARSMFVSPHDLSALAVVICGAGVVGVVATLRLVDELERRRLMIAAGHERQEALERSRRELVAWVSHDLRTPLAGIRVMAEALSDGVVDDPETVAGYHRRIQVEAERLARLVDDLFELSRLQVERVSLAVERISLGDLVSDAVASAAPTAGAKGVELTGELVGPAPELDVSSPEMLRVVQNLLDNAIRHTPAGGVVKVEVRHTGGHAELAVEDGCGGIPHTDIERVFDLAYRGDSARTPAHGGGGLGLAIARGLVEAHAGVIDVRNVDGGCRFTVRLPMPAA
ncbi:MAG: ATP-binding protein [Acidimicrobiales bacterium]